MPSYDGKPCFVLLRNRFRNSCVDVNPSFTLLNENVCFAKHTSLDEYLVVSHLTSQETRVSQQIPLCLKLSHVVNGKRFLRFMTWRPPFHVTQIRICYGEHRNYGPGYRNYHPSRKLQIPARRHFDQNPAALTGISPSRDHRLKKITRRCQLTE